MPLKICQRMNIFLLVIRIKIFGVLALDARCACANIQGQFKILKEIHIAKNVPAQKELIKLKKKKKNRRSD